MGLEIWREITTEYHGREIKGSFKFLDGVVTVRTLRGSKAAQVRGQTPEQLAKTLLRELAREGMV
jgi:prolyl-tRNA editing enzyme YbaK/EbsC (Cys-tRNA(Pro) deacylase)